MATKITVAPVDGNISYTIQVRYGNDDFFVNKGGFETFEEARQEVKRQGYVSFFGIRNVRIRKTTVVEEFLLAS